MDNDWKDEALEVSYHGFDAHFSLPFVRELEDVEHVCCIIYFFSEIEERDHC